MRIERARVNHMTASERAISRPQLQLSTVVLLVLAEMEKKEVSLWTPLEISMWLGENGVPDEICEVFEGIVWLRPLISYVGSHKLFVKYLDSHKLFDSKYSPLAQQDSLCLTPVSSVILFSLAGFFINIIKRCNLFII